MTTLIGTWRLIDGRTNDEQGASIPTPLGPQPMGVAEFGPERMMVVVGDSRPALPVNVQNRVLVAYQGPYTFDGSTLVTTVDAASDPSLVGTEQTRTIRRDGNRMEVRPANRIAGVTNEAVFTWEKVGESSEP